MGGWNVAAAGGDSEPLHYSPLMAVRRDTRKARFFWPPLLAVVLSDLATKAIAVALLAPPHLPRPVLGDTVRLTLLYNPGAAFGLYVGPHSRWILLGLALGALVVMWRLYRDTAPNQVIRVLALGSVSGGAVANVINRLWSARGVVDFIDFGIGDARWPAFNVADMAISVGAVLLAWVLWRDDKHQAAIGLRGNRGA